MGSFDRGGRGGGRSFARGGGGFGGNNRGPRGDRPMFQTTCSNCGKECEVPFRPTNGKPVYCSDCFEKMGPRREEREDRGNFRAPVSESNKAQLDMIVVKLDKIIRLLEPKNVEAVMPDLVVEEVKSASVKDSGEAKVKKTQKVAKTIKKLSPTKPGKAISGTSR